MIFQMAFFIGAKQGISQPRTEFIKCRFKSESELTPCTVSALKKSILRYNSSESTCLTSQMSVALEVLVSLH